MAENEKQIKKRAFMQKSMEARFRLSKKDF